MAESLTDIDDLDLGGLKKLVLKVLEENARLKQENTELREEIAQLKGLKGKPDIKPSGMEKKAGTGSDKKGGKKKIGRRGAKQDKLSIDETKILKPDNVPDGSRFKGYEDVIIQNLIVRPWIIRFRRERWKTPSGETILANLPAGIAGNFGPDLKRFILAQYHQCQVTVSRLEQQMHDIGVLISKRQIMRILNDNKADFTHEALNVLRAGLETAGWITVDDTGARHEGRNQYCTQFGNDHFAFFATTGSKSRLNFLDLLRAGTDEYVINQAALDYMRERNLSKSVIDILQAHENTRFAGKEAWTAHLETLGIHKLKVHPDPVKIATEGALWGMIADLGLLDGTVIISDGAGQFRVGEHGLCWVHAERLVHKLNTFCDAQHNSKEKIRKRIWRLYADLKTYTLSPTPKRKSQLKRRFDSIFTTTTNFVTLDRLLARLHARKDELLKVLERPDIPLHTNGSENDIRCQVTKRKISGGTRSDEGRQNRDAFLSLMKTCFKLGVSFWDYLGARLDASDATKIPPLPNLIRQAATT